MTSTAAQQTSSPQLLMRSILQRIATGPELSKDISQEEAQAGMRMILNGEVDPVQAGIFLIALRMKRETDDETKGILDALSAAAERATAAVDEVLDLADPYDGYNRTLPASPFLPAVLAACGVPTVSHGVASMGPKYGVTHNLILAAAGVDVDAGPQQAAAALAEPGLGWAYVDQRQFCPQLYDLKELRSLIVKRPALTTVEVLIGPVRGRRKTHLMTGYVHKPYPRLYALLARHVGFDSAVLVRGVEGAVIPSLRQAGKLVHYRDLGEESSVDLDPQALDIKQDVRAAPLPDDLPTAARAGDEIAIAVDIEATARAAVDAGMAALQGKPGAVRDSLIYGGAIALWHLRRCSSLAEGAATVRAVLDNGLALAHFKAAT